MLYLAKLSFFETPCTYIMDTCIMDTYIMDICIMDTSAWVTRPERPKGGKDEVKEARGAKRRPEGLQIRSWGPEGPPKLLVAYNAYTAYTAYTAYFAPTAPTVNAV